MTDDLHDRLTARLRDPDRKRVIHQFPEELGKFLLYPPDTDGGQWGMSYRQVWLPILLADRDACLMVAKLVLAGLDDGPLIELRDRYNRAQPSVGVTVQHLVEHIEGAKEEDEEDEE